MNNNMSPSRIIANINMWRSNLPNLRKESPSYVCQSCDLRQDWLESMEELCIIAQGDMEQLREASAALIQVHINVGEVAALYHEFKCK